MNEKNKRRMYIAYYHRTPTPSLPVKYHTSLLMTPKNPNTMDTVKKCWRYHVMDRVAPPGDNAGGYWIFEARRAYARSSRLAGVVLLGKVPHSVSNEDIEKIVRSVPMKTTVAEDPSWRCRHWVWDAMTHLANNEVISSLLNKPEAIWDTGASFVEGCGSATDNEEIPCCNTNGKRLPSEIGPMKYEI
ncbi:hypothetical protein BYT27DRAFT_7245531 [Phlegmacium glaucopus]|nr:hypothetical protein BYT27DRAFT_7245531 [Phlegmacium glaucopus]